MNAPLRVLLVDDERLARKWLRDLFANHPEIQIAGEAADVEAAARLAAQERPDAVFLDVQMPPGTGFDVLPHLPSGTKVVFVTAYDQFAVKAFDAHALDYLLKPVSPERLAETVRRLLAWQASTDGREAEAEGAGTPDRLQLQDYLPLKDRGRLHLVPVDAITAVLADAGYTRVFASGRAPLFLLQSIGDWEARLPTPPFARLDRSTLVHLGRVREVRTLTRDASQVFLEGKDEPVTLGRAATARLRKSLRGPRRHSG